MRQTDNVKEAQGFAICNPTTLRGMGVMGWLGYLDDNACSSVYVLYVCLKELLEQLGILERGSASES